jgi:superfamily II DNA or RNA helicase
MGPQRTLLDSAPSGLRRFEREFSPKTRARGLTYAVEGRVDVVEAKERALRAAVRGTNSYRVDLELRDGDLLARCECPQFVDSSLPCKHVWATLLTVNARGSLPALREARTLALEAAPRSGDGVDAAALEASSWEASVRALSGSSDSVAPLRASAPGWREVLSQIVDAPPPGPAERRDHPELRYVVDPERTRQRGRLVIRPLGRARKGARGGWRPAQIARPFVECADLDDAVVLGVLDAVSPISPYQTGRVPVTFEIAGESAAGVLERLCATERARLGNPDGPALRWDAEPYSLCLEACPQEGAEDLVVHTWLERGSERVPAQDAVLLLPGGLVFWPDRVAPFDDCGQFGWVTSERQRRRSILPPGEIPDFVDALNRAPASPRLQLPPAYALPEVRVPGRPYASLRTTDPEADFLAIAVEAGFEYQGVRVPLEARGRAVVDRRSRRLILRDVAAESAAVVQLGEVGVRQISPLRRSGHAADVAWALSPGRLEGAARDLLARGWRVEVDGRPRRAVASFSVDVTTGIDWFDVRVSVAFDGVEAPLPELRAAVAQRRRTVTLADGSVGDLPDGVQDRLRRWAGMAHDSGGVLRFGRAQAALIAALADGEEGVSFDQGFEKARAELARFEGISPKGPPRTFRGTLRDYQRHALGWFEVLRRFGFGGCLADDMGLGKTVQVLAMLDARRKDDAAPSLVVAPRSVLANWASEAARFAPRLRVFLHDGTDRLPPGDHFGEHDLVLTTYGILRQDAAPLSAIAFDYVILDEAQAIKTAQTASAKAARALQARHRLALTGTPLENHLGELASLLDFLNPGVLGSSGALASLADSSRRVDPATREILAHAVRPFFLRRTKRQVAPELPGRIEQTLVCELPPEQRRIYDELHAHYRDAVLGRAGSGGTELSTAHILEALLRLRQVACHPGLVDPARRGDPSAKLDTLLEQLETLRAEGQKALVFSQFTSLLAIVKERLDERGIVYEYLDGATRDRAARVERFQTDETCGVFLLSLKAGGVGLNLTAAEYVFVLDPWWNPAVEAQAIDRAHRIGQTRAVFAYRLLARGTVEEKVALLQAEKRELADAFFGEGAPTLAGLTREDLQRLLA